MHYYNYSSISKFAWILVVLVSAEWIRCISTETFSGGSDESITQHQVDLNNSLVADENLKNATLAQIDLLKDFENIKDGMTILINQLRNCHNVNPFQRDDSVDSQATSWAQHMASTGQFGHSNNGWGENIYFQSWSLGSNGFDCVKAWYCECSGSYIYGSENNSLNCGHFTQLAWKGSTSIGLGIARSSRGNYVVANFNPPGNFRGRYRANVFQPNMNCVNSVVPC